MTNNLKTFLSIVFSILLCSGITIVSFSGDVFADKIIVELDRKVYTWTDKVYITIVAPEFNLNDESIDEIGTNGSGKITVSTRNHSIEDYKLVETSTNSGIFWGYVILTGFTHNAGGDPNTNGNEVITQTSTGNGNIDGVLSASNYDGIQVIFELSEDEAIVGSALIRWNIGEVQWLDEVYDADVMGIVRVIDRDMNLNPEKMDMFDIHIWSDFDVGGITLTVTETNEATGIFQGNVHFSTTGQSHDNFLVISPGNTVTAEYKDHTLPDPYTTVDKLNIYGITTIVGDSIPTINPKITLDKKSYTWTDKVSITVDEPEFNSDSNKIESIGISDENRIKISTRGGHTLHNYELVETGKDTGIFSGYVILTGFLHDADGNKRTGDKDGHDTDPITNDSGQGRGFLESSDNDAISVSIQSGEETIIDSALIKWNIGESQWLEASYLDSGTGIVRVIDPDMNLNPESVDNFDVDVWSDSDVSGINLTVTETNDATGVFEGTVFFTSTDNSSGHRLQVIAGDTITIEYEDNTLPSPYTTADELDIVATSLIGSVAVLPFEKLLPDYLSIVLKNSKIVNGFGSKIDTIFPEQQVQVTSELFNISNIEQPFSYVVKVIDNFGNTAQPKWITGILHPYQSLMPSLSWTPKDSGEYVITIEVWNNHVDKILLSKPTNISVMVEGDIISEQKLSEQHELFVPAKISEIQPHSSHSVKELGIASFVDQTKDPQYYVDRYNNEVNYKKWFDDNYPEYDSIYKAVDFDESKTESHESICGDETQLVDGVCQIVNLHLEPSSATDLNPKCGTGTDLVDGVCQIVNLHLEPSSATDLNPKCGTGTDLVDGVCQIVDSPVKSKHIKKSNSFNFSDMFSFFENIFN